MIYDGHAYCAQDPSLGGGFEDRSEFDRFLQLFMATSRQQPVWRKRDRVPGDASGLVDPERPWDFDALKEAAFRTAENGRVEWDVDGETFVKQALPPWVDHLTFTVDNLVAEMDYVGVDMALLHRTPYMSKSNEFIADCVRAYPDRIQGLAYIEEWLLASDTDACIRKLQHAINDLGLHGYQFMPHHMDLYGLDWKWASPTFTPFWDALSDLDIPVFFTLYSTNYAEYLEELRTLGRWMERYPDVTVVQTHGFNWRMFADDEKLVVPDEVYDAAPIDNPNYHIQLLFAVFLQRRWDYPMPQILPTMEQMYRRMGPDKLIWGTDIPVSLLWWTYRQNLEFLRSYCNFIPQSDMDLILGGNMARIMGVKASTSGSSQ